MRPADGVATARRIPSTPASLSRTEHGRALIVFEIGDSMQVVRDERPLPAAPMTGDYIPKYNLVESTVYRSHHVLDAALHTETTAINCMNN